MRGTGSNNAAFRQLPSRTQTTCGERIVLKNFLMGSARAEQAQNVCDTNALTADARAPAAFAGFDSDSVKLAGIHILFNRVDALPEV